MPKKEKVERNISYFNLLGLGLVAVCYFGAIWNVMQVKKDEYLFDKRVVRLCHWQLEKGVKEGLDEMIKLYEKQKNEEIEKYNRNNPGKEKAKVKIIQIPITEKAYRQWVTTQLIGRTAPDIIEIGMFDVNLYLARYFTPITDELRKPNPYNKDNPNIEMRTGPWMDTFIDGLQNSYVPELLDYYMVGLSQFSVRIFYNKDLFKKILGTDASPKDLSQFFSYCQRIQDYVNNQNKEIEKYNKRCSKNMSWWQYLPFAPTGQKELKVLVPIASSKYQVNLFKSRYLSMLTADLALDLDKDMDGKLLGEEKIRALLLGELTFDNEKIKAASELLRDMAKYFTPGFMSGDRMESGFAFVQGRAAMITSGSWDANSFIKQVKDQPFGDIILEINGNKPESAVEAGNALMKLKGNKPVKILINREGAKKLLKIYPSQAGDTLWSVYGFRLKNVKEKDRNLVVVDEVDTVSPAADSGFMPRQTFEVGIFDFPAPTKNDPKFGKLVAGPVAESSQTGFRFGITKFSQNKDIALDFFRFCSTPKNNEKFNEIAQWIPAVKGARPSKMLKAFVPNFKGYWGSVSFGTDSRSRSGVREKQIFWPYISGEINYKEYSDSLKKTMPRPMANDYDTIVMTKAENLPDKMVQRSIYLAKYVFSRDQKELDEAKRKLTASWDVILDYELANARLKALMTPAFENPAKNQFSNDFLSIYNNIKTKR